MTNRAQMLILGLSLLLLSVIWSWFVIETIPAGYGDGEIGARIFPLTFGLSLLALSLLLLVNEFLFFKNHSSTIGIFKQLKILANDAPKWLPAFIVFFEIVLYGFLLEKIGFVLATPLVIILLMTINLKIRSVSKILVISIGLTSSCWIIFEKIFGIYLANGLWVNLG